MNEIQQTIQNYMKNKTEPGVFDLDCFVGMIETGEATYDDFETVGGTLLAADVAKAKQNREDIRNENV